MSEISISKKHLENAMKIAFLSTEAVENIISGHCLFCVDSNILEIFATDKKTRISKSIINISSETSFKFTVDPRKILKLIKTIDMDFIRFEFEDATMNLKIYLSETNENFVSLPSFDPKTYAPIEDNFDKAFEIKTINAGVFLGGLQFMKGFLLDKHPKFSNMFISKGVFYGANGNNKAGAFTSPDLENLDELVFPLSTFPAISNLITTLDLSEIIISSSSNHIFISSPDKNCVFGFSKVQMKMPRIPITTEEPTISGWKVDKNLLQKKLSRLHLTGDATLGIKIFLDNDIMHMETLLDRASKDNLPCENIRGASKTECITEVRLIENILNQFGADKLEMYVDKKITFFNKAELKFTVNGAEVFKPFICAGAIPLSQLS